METSSLKIRKCISLSSPSRGYDGLFFRTSNGGPTGTSKRKRRGENGGEFDVCTDENATVDQEEQPMNEDDGRKSELQDDNATADDSNGEPVDEQDEERVTARFVSNMMKQNLLNDRFQTASIVRVEHRRKGQTDPAVFVVISLSTHEQVNIEHLWSLCIDHPLSLSSRFRIFCHRVCNHRAFGYIVLVCILLSSISLGAEDPVDSDSFRNKVNLRFVLEEMNASSTRPV